jgi:hypothetical protein
VRVRRSLFFIAIMLTSVPTAALRQAADKLPRTYEFIRKSTPPRLGRLLITDNASTPSPEAEATSRS